MLKKVKDHSFSILIYFGIIITIALTPWGNVDSLIIPKEILLFSLAVYFLPVILLNIKFFSINIRLKLLLVLGALFIIQMLIVMIKSSAPIEQQIFGRTGRGLGFLTEFSIILITITASIYIKYQKIDLLIIGVVVSSVLSSIYSIAQHFGFDFFAWDTRTNGIIGTLGNPNFQSSIAALAFMPTVSFFFKKKVSVSFSALVSCLIFIYTIYICESTQGYILIVISCSIFMLVFTWYKNRLIFFSSLLTIISLALIAIFGMLNHGPLSSVLYKSSVKSRGEFWRSAFSATKENPLFGVGLDSFGDVSTLYKNARDSMGINEFTDNAHNYFLHYSATGGFILFILYALLIILVFFSFIMIQRHVGKFDYKITSLFTCLICFQAQSIISPGTISLMVWNAIISGSLIGLSAFGKSDFTIKTTQLSKILSYVCIGISLLITYPLYSADHLQLKSLKEKDGLLAVKAAKSYPESSLRYSRIGIELLKSGLLEQALEVGRSAVRFNPNSINAWALVLANNAAPLEERIRARDEILRIDPYNNEIKRIDLNTLGNLK